MALQLNIYNTMSFDKNDTDIKRMFAVESKSRVKYSLDIQNGEKNNENFYSSIQKDKFKKISFWKKLIS